MTLFEVIRHISHGAIQIGDDEAGHLVAGLALALSHQALLVIRQYLGYDREIAPGLQFAEILPGTEEVKLAQILADVLVAARNLACLVVGKAGVQLVVDVADGAEAPVAIGQSHLPLSIEILAVRSSTSLVIGIGIAAVESVAIAMGWQIAVETVGASLNLVFCLVVRLRRDA